MIRPSSRLIFFAGAIIVPVLTLAGMLPQAFPLSGIILGLFLCFVLIDAVRGRRALNGLSVSVSKRLNFFKSRPAVFDLHIKNELQFGRRARFGLPLPPEFIVEQEDLWADLPDGAQASKIQWSCTPTERGNFELTRCYFEAFSPLGLWTVRGHSDLATEIRVYPNLMTERKNVSMLFLDRMRTGIHTQRQVGKGRDFEKLREYVTGDSIDDIHWKATAKRSKPVTKVFQIERTQEVYIALDCSRLSARETGDFDLANPQTGSDKKAVVALDRFITTALLLGIAAEQQGDLFGLITFSDKVHTLIRAKNGKAHYGVCRDALYTLHPRLVTPDFEEVCSAIRLRLRRRALVVFLTTLDDPLLAENFTRGLDLIHRQHLVIVNMIEPAGVSPLFSDEKEINSIPDLYRKLGGHLLWHKLREFQKILERRGVKFSLVPNERLTGEIINQYITVKQRQLL